MIQLSAVLVIRNQQLAILKRAARAGFEARLVDYVVQHFPPRPQLPPERVRDFVSQQIDRAESYELTSERDAALYVLAAWRFGENFDRPHRSAPRGALAPGVPIQRRRKWLRSIVDG